MNKQACCLCRYWREGESAWGTCGWDPMIDMAMIPASIEIKRWKIRSFEGTECPVFDAKTNFIPRPEKKSNE